MVESAGDALLSTGHYLVIGTPGRTGTRVVRKLAAAGATIRVLLHPTPLAELPKDEIEVARGDYGDRDSLLQATDDVDWVIATAGGSATHLIGRCQDEPGPTHGSAHVTNGGRPIGFHSAVCDAGP